MYKFSIVDVANNKRDIVYLLKELKQKNLIAGTEKDVNGDTIYLTNSLSAVRKIMEEYEGLMLDVHK